MDKTHLIEQLLDNPSQVSLFPRPRLFGKTLNLSMLRYFFEQTETSNRGLFDGLAVSKNAEAMAQQWQYPVIYLTFKDVKEDTWEKCYRKIGMILAEELDRHLFWLNQMELHPREFVDFEALTMNQAEQAVSVSRFDAGLDDQSFRPLSSPVQPGIRLWTV
ncbi:MAG: AAA family ATPase [SAR324 cluster bacterium]|nr:AAA family ATPase [SAR324 cluster bacterium]